MLTCVGCCSRCWCLLRVVAVIGALGAAVEVRRVLLPLTLVFVVAWLVAVVV